MASPPSIPRLKALLSRDGGICPRDGAVLRFDPRAPSAHRCTRCDTIVRGPRHDRHWARSQHLWLAERAAHLAVAGALTEDLRMLGVARDLVAAYPSIYAELPNRDNVLGPTHLFFSTYLESMWLVNYLTAAYILRDVGALDETGVAHVSEMLEEASTLIGEFHEGMSNRQTWHAAALAAVAAWFEDEELAEVAVTGPTGLLAHLTDGFGKDGVWHEGENYHLFALQGLLRGLAWGSLAGIDLLADPELETLLGGALVAPALTALPDGTFPARKDARYGVSLAHPAYLELWETGRAWCPSVREALDGWLTHLYALPAPPALRYDAYLHEAAEPVPERRGREDLSWWALLTMPGDPPRPLVHTPASVYLPDQGVAVLRHGATYCSLETRSRPEGHGHPDALHLSLHAQGFHWLPDFGAGSYVAPDLAWYRSPWAHNVPLVAGVPLTGDCHATAFAISAPYGWARAGTGSAERTVVLGPGWVVSVLATGAGASGDTVDLLWHLQGTLAFPAGAWRAATLDQPFVTGAEGYDGGGEAPLVVRSVAGSGAAIALHVPDPGTTLLRATAPGIPEQGMAPFLIQRATQSASGVTLHAAIDLRPDDPDHAIDRVECGPDMIVLVHRDGGRTVLRFDARGVEIAAPDGTVRLEGLLAPRRRVVPLFTPRPPWSATAHAIGIADPPVMDGTFDGFADAEPLVLNDEHQYRRSEEPYPGEEEFRATAWVNWTLDGLYVAVEVEKSDLAVRAADAGPLDYDNDPEDIHTESVQIYVQAGDGPARGYLVALAPDGGIRAHVATGAAGDPADIRGAWQPRDADRGYLLTVGITAPELGALPRGSAIRFDLLVNEIRADRERRAGQLVWSGADGWIYLQSDRHDPRAFGTLELR